jgi:serine/threonine protein kinase
MIQKFGKFSEKLMKVYLREILNGLHYLHIHGVVHRDIKGANVLVDTDGKCKLAGNAFIIKIDEDFGSSKKLTEIRNLEQRSLFGTPNFMAPEVVK